MSLDVIAQHDQGIGFSVNCLFIDLDTTSEMIESKIILSALDVKDSHISIRNKAIVEVNLGGHKLSR